MVDPPPLPHRLADMRVVVGAGSLLWLLAAAALFAAWLMGERPLDLLFLTCVTGALLGAVGFGVFSWQRAAARRGSRTAQQGLAI